jgi:hypothetical protein
MTSREAIGTFETRRMPLRRPSSTVMDVVLLNVASDAAEAVDAHSDGHGVSSLRN